MCRPRRLRCALLALFLCAASHATATVVTFDSGLQGWTGPAPGVGGIGTTLETSGGNPGADARIQFADFGIALANATDPAFTGDLRPRGRLTIGADIRVNDINLLGKPVERDLIVEFRSHALAQPGYPWASVYTVIASLRSPQPWLPHEATFDPAATSLPAGWGGYGAEDPQTGAPSLPAGVSYADVMGAVDEVAFSTLVPGYFFDQAVFDVQFDNLRIAAAAPPPAPVATPMLGTAARVGLTCALLLLAGAALRRRRGRRT